MSWRDRIAATIMGLFPSNPGLSNMQELGKRGVFLDSYRAPNDPPYREDRPGVNESTERYLRAPMIGPQIDPRMAPPPKAMLGLTPTNDRSVVDPEELPMPETYASYRYRS